MNRTILNRETFFFMALFFIIITENIYGQNNKILCDFEDIPLDSIKKNDAQISYHYDNGLQKLNVTFGSNSLNPKVQITDSLIGNQVWDLSQYVYVTAEIENLDTENSIQVFGYFNNFKRGNGILLLSPGEKGKLKIAITRDLSDLDTNITKFLQKEFAGLSGGYTTGFTPSPDSIHSICIHAVKLKTSHTIRISNIQAETLYITNSIDTNSMMRFIDKFGQYKYMPDTFKTNTIAQMAKQDTLELADITNNPGPETWNEYGGWLMGPKYDSTGHFYTKKVDNKWWLIDPCGRLYWSNGIDNVGISQSTYMTEEDNDYSKFFDQEPKHILNDDNNIKQAFFYKSNLQDKFEYQNSENWEADAADRIHKRLRSWGINTLGNWSDWRLCIQRKTPYVVHIKSAYKPINPTKVDTIADPQAWHKIHDAISNQFDAHTYSINDPYCIGYFIDNEMYFEHFTDKEYREYVIDRYYAMCDTIQKTKAPDKLNLGSRLHFYNKFNNHEAVQIAAMGKYCDVISINRYSYIMRDLPALKDVDPTLDKPLIIGEFHFGARDKGFSWIGLKGATDQEQRAELYKLYISECLEHENIVGAHWFSYTDQMYSTRYDKENGQIGWVDVCDNPNKELIDAARKVNYSMYEKRFGSSSACGNYESWNPDQQWLTYNVGNIREDSMKVWECINQTYSYLKPSSPSGHYGWLLIEECSNEN